MPEYYNNLLEAPYEMIWPRYSYDFRLVATPEE